MGTLRGRRPVRSAVRGAIGWFSASVCSRLAGLSQRSAQRCARDDTVVAATGIARGETGYPGAATSGMVKDSPGFIQAMPTKMKTGSPVAVPRKNRGGGWQFQNRN